MDFYDPTMRSLEELTVSDDPAWPTVATWIAASPYTVDVLPAAGSARDHCLYRLQVTTRSVLGALAWHTGGVCVDHGWLRLLGSGSVGLTDLATASGMGEPSAESAPPPFLVVAYDVLGGQFAVNGGGLPGQAGHVAYFAPDSLAWMSLEMGHGQFVEWCLTGDTAGFYADLRWHGWEAESSALKLDQGITVCPPLFTKEAQANLAATARSAVPWDEILGLQQDLAEQLQAIPDGGSFRIQVTNDDQAAPGKKRWRR